MRLLIDGELTPPTLRGHNVIVRPPHQRFEGFAFECSCGEAKTGMGRNKCDKQVETHFREESKW